MPDGAPLPSIDTPVNFGLCLAFSPDGKLIAAGDLSGTVYVWQAISLQLLHAFPGDTLQSLIARQTVRSVSFSPDGKLLAAGTVGGGFVPEAGPIPPVVKIWKMEDGSEFRRYTNHSYIPWLPSTDDSFNAISFSADGRLVLAGAQNRQLYFWRMQDGALLGLLGTDESVRSIAVSPDLKHYALGFGAGTLAVANNLLWVDRIERHNGQTVVGWQGGGGLYQLQLSANLAAHQWQNAGDWTSSHVATNSSSSPAFYRVESQTVP